MSTFDSISNVLNDNDCDLPKSAKQLNMPVYVLREILKQEPEVRKRINYNRNFIVDTALDNLKERLFHENESKRWESSKWALENMAHDRGIGKMNKVSIEHTVDWSKESEATIDIMRKKLDEQGELKNTKAPTSVVREAEYE